MIRMGAPGAPSQLAALLAVGVLSTPLQALPSRPETATLDRRVAEAEASLKLGQLQLAESQYRDALHDGWMLLGTLARISQRTDAAREAFGQASSSAVDNRAPLQALALLHLQAGEPAAAVPILERLVRARPADVPLRRLLSRALGASGRHDEAIAQLVRARKAEPQDPETLFALGAAYLAAKRGDEAARAFAELVAARPMARTRVLVGRTYRDYGEYGRARTELAAALAQDPRVRRAHYYLGSVAVAEHGRAGLDEAVREFQAELKLAPDDPATNLELGMALVDTQQPERALPALEAAARAGASDPRILYYMGRAQLGAGRSEDAAATLRLALDAAERLSAPDEQRRVIHNQLGQALRQLGRTEEAAPHFAEAQRLSAQSSETAREELDRRASGAEETLPDSSPSAAGVPQFENSPLASLPPTERDAIERRVKGALARAYLNLGIMLAQGGRFTRAADELERGQTLDPELAQLQSSLGIAHFNARQFDKAVPPLERALQASPRDPDLKRMLAMAHLNTQQYEKAAELLRDDPELDSNGSLRFAYGMALARSGRPAEAEAVYARLLRQRGDSAELAVLLGKGYAQTGDFPAAITSFERALAQDPKAAEANAALGVIYFKQGRLADAEAALRRELALRPDDLQSRQNLAQVLEADLRPDEALPLVRSVLAAQPDFAEARYLLGKILLAQGALAEAVEHLEAAARLNPAEANAHYQLGRAYTRLGRSEDAQREFEISRQIKAKR